VPFDFQSDSLGYAIRLSDLREARMRRAETMLEALRAAGYGVTIDDVLLLSDGGAVGRSHIARALVAGGHAENVADAFRRFIGRGQPFYVPKDVRSPEDAIEVIRAAGGLAVLAHPGVTGDDYLIPRLIGAGLSGIEAHHADHSPEQREAYATMANELGLLATGGSDFHGPEAPNPDIGEIDIPPAAIEAFLSAGGVA
jgi:hypothetical protein